MDVAIRRFELAVLGHVGKNRKSTEYRRFFSNGLSALVEAPFAGKVAGTLLLEREIQAGGGPKDGADWQAILAPRREAAEKARELLVAAVADHATASTKEMRAREDWLRRYRGVYGAPISLFPTDLRRVESYFRSPQTRPTAKSGGALAIQGAAKPEAPAA